MFLPGPCPCEGRPRCWPRPRQAQPAAPALYPAGRGDARTQLTPRAPCSRQKQLTPRVPSSRQKAQHNMYSHENSLTVNKLNNKTSLARYTVTVHYYIVHTYHACRNLLQSQFSFSS